ncbi:MAG TPA: hypothetical protein P5121_33445, partial [Caldilineaceae bacterium]|nr:hypothetical protein [Caldilineaceae bacterium]
VVILYVSLSLLGIQPTSAQSNRPPQFATISDRTIYEKDQIRISVVATDPDKDSVRIFVAPNLLPLPPGATLEEERPGIATVHFVPEQTGVFQFALVAEDNGTPVGRTATFFQVTVNPLPADYVDVAIADTTVRTKPNAEGVREGEIFEYVIVVANHGTVAADAVTLQIQLDDDLSIQSYHEDSDGTCTSSAGTITCTFGTIPRGENRYLGMLLLPTEEGPTLNMLDLTTASQDLVLYNNDLNETIPIGPPLVDLSILSRVKSTGSPEYEIGDEVQVEVSVYNNADVATNFTLTNTIPAGFALITIEDTATERCQTTAERIICHSAIAAFQPLSPVTYTFTFRIVAEGVQVMPSHVIGSDPDPDPSDNQTAVEINVVAVVDLSVTNELLPTGDTDVGDTVIFNIAVHNPSIVATSFALTNTLSAGLEYVSIESVPATPCTVSGNAILCQGTVNAEESVVYLVTVRITDKGIQEVVANVSSATTIDPELDNNSASESLFAVIVGDIKVTLSNSDDQSFYEVGDLVATAMRVEASALWPLTNFGSIDAFNTIPAGLVPVLVENVPPDVSCTIDGAQQEIKCRNFNMRAGDQYEVDIILQAVAIGTWQDRADVPEVGYSDTAPANNQAQLTINVVELITPTLFIHTFDDVNGNGVQDPGEPSLPGFKIDTSTIDGNGEQQHQNGSTNDRGLLELPLGDLPAIDELTLTAQFTPTTTITETITETITPVVSVQIPLVPPTGAATISGASRCGMTVHQTSGSAFTLPCTAENTLAWTNQRDVSLATFAATIVTAPLRAAGVNQMAPIEVRFEIAARDNHAVYLPLVQK